MLKTEPPFEKEQDKSLDNEQIGRAIGRLTSGVYVMTLEANGVPEGILMTWIGQAAFEPPLISVAVKKGRPILDHLTKGSRFTVNVLSKKNMDVFKHFARPNVAPAERFAGLTLVPKKAFGPIFASVVAYLNCSVTNSHEAGDHYLIVAEVVGGEVLDPDAEPMSHLRRSGFQY
jgi:flavin reductase (DIM6/NTAB) family NADH-FMN oxidoreductase RutF